MIDFSENANQGAICQTVDVPSLATRPRSVKIPISFFPRSLGSHAPAPALPFVRPAAFGARFTVDTRHRYRTTVAADPAAVCVSPRRTDTCAIFECARSRMDNAFQRGTWPPQIALFSGRDFTRGNARKGRPDLSLFLSKTGSPYPCHRQCAKGGGKKSARRGRRAKREPTRVSISIDGRARSRARRPLSPSLRDRKADLDAKSYLHL